VRRPHPIEAESYRILRRLVDLSGHDPLGRAVVERVVHATAEPGWAADLVLDEPALRLGLAALRAGALVVADNTFASPYLQTPLAHGVDLVLHSTTKYIGGHSDVVGGAIVGRDEELRERLAFLQNAVGGVPGPFDAWLVLRGAKTLAVRMERHSANGMAIAHWLAEHPKVKCVNYPGLPRHPQHDLARRQMKSFGGMLSFELRGGEAAAKRMAARTELFALAESLGGVESLVEVPLAMTHGSVRGTKLAPPPSLVRLSVGIETVDDLIADLAQAIA
jgi:cystathionine gamma-synthase